MKYFFDNNLSPHLAHAIQELCRVEETVARVIHLRDRFAPDAKDHDWIKELGAEGRWVVLLRMPFVKTTSSAKPCAIPA